MRKELSIEVHVGRGLHPPRKKDLRNRIEASRRPNGGEINKFRENLGPPTVVEIHKLVKSELAPTGRK